MPLFGKPAREVRDSKGKSLRSVPQKDLKAKKDASVRLLKAVDKRPHAERFNYDAVKIASLAEGLKNELGIK